jgi:hypothetical protein
MKIPDSRQPTPKFAFAVVQYFDFDEAIINIATTPKPPKSEKDKDFDFPDTVLNIDISKE